MVFHMAFVSECAWPVSGPANVWQIQYTMTTPLKQDKGMGLNTKTMSGIVVSYVLLDFSRNHKKEVGGYLLLWDGTTVYYSKVK